MQQLIVDGKQALLERLYDSTDCRGNARVGLRPGKLFPHIAALWVNMTPKGVSVIVPLHGDGGKKVLRLQCGDWEIWVVDANNQEILAPDPGEGMDEAPLLAAYLLARYTGIPTQTSKATLQIRGHLTGVIDMLPPAHCAGFVRVLMTQLNDDFERIET